MPDNLFKALSISTLPFVVLRPPSPITKVQPCSLHPIPSPSGHHFSSYTQKVLIAHYENATPFEFRSIGPDTPQHVADWMRRWPLRKFPVLVDGERDIAETSIIIEYLQLTHGAWASPTLTGSASRATATARS